MKSTDYTYEIGQIANILANPDYTLDKILEYQGECLKRIEFGKSHGGCTAHEARSMRIFNACIELIKEQYEF